MDLDDKDSPEDALVASSSTYSHYLKRIYNTAEAQRYLGLSRTMFYKHILPRIEHKVRRVGVGKLFEVRDLDAAWDAFLEDQATAKEKQVWKKPASQASTPKTDNSKSIKSFDLAEFDAVASAVSKKRKTT